MSLSGSCTRAHAGADAFSYMTGIIWPLHSNFSGRRQGKQSAVPLHAAWRGIEDNSR